MVEHLPLPPTVRERVAALPEQPGVYLFRGAGGELLYVGKALSLKKRVASYFRHARLLPPKVARMVARIAELETRTVASEAEALLLEAQLIKELKPRYNVSFRDDKMYPMLKITNEPYPRLRVTRRKLADGATYFGPYTDAALMHQAVRFMRRVFPMRTCRTFPETPCLEYHLGQCLAPCAGYITAGRYQRIVDDLIAFLQGKRDRLLKDLIRRMRHAARDRRFEEAARLRDQVQALTSVIVAKEKSLAAGPLEQLQAALKLPRLPRRIEAFDISNIFGTYAVGSMVVFTEGRPHKAHYRRFRIKTVQGSDDYRMMREVIRRRYGGSLTREQQLPQPDLLLIDGGKGQLSAAGGELAALKLDTPVMGLAKRFEHIFLPGQEAPVVLLPSSPVLHLVQHIRDEAHRFAITYHRQIRDKAVTASALDRVPGIGPKRKMQLLRHFRSVEALSGAKAEDVAEVAGVPDAVAADLLRRLNREYEQGV